MRNFGLLLLRIGLGVMFLYHGGPKIVGGPDMWKAVGASMGNLGIHAVPWLWGLLAGLAEFFGGMALIAGIGTRVAAAILTFVMFVATLHHLNLPGQGVREASHAIELGLVFFSLVFIGPGKFSVDALLWDTENKPARKSKSSA